MLKIACLSLQYPVDVSTIAREIGVFPVDEGDDLPFVMGVIVIFNDTTRAMLNVHKLSLAAKHPGGTMAAAAVPCDVRRRHD